MHIKIANKKIGDECPVFIIAEAGINHNGSVKIAKKMIDVAKEVNADCIKFQTFKAKEFIVDPKVEYTYKSQGEIITEPQIKMFERYEFSDKEWQEVIDYCKKKKVIFSTTAQNPSDLDFILSLTDLPFIKVGSDDLTNLGLIDYYAKKKKPMIISAGMAYESEINDAVNIIRKAGNNDIVVLHCVSSYPAKPEDTNLRKLRNINDKFGVIVGFSDHTQGIYACLGAVALGARVIEKHFTLDKNMSGPDHWFSADPEEFEKLVEGIRCVEKSLGDPIIKPTLKEMKMRKIARRSIVAAKNVEKGKIITMTDVGFKRPGTGLAPKFLDNVISKKAKINIKKGDLITFKNIK
jgi:N-acetylneuraminate synthase/N,N'-diacetyllegionaminate synthase